MASNSLASILEKMKQQTITEKWGAVLALDRARVNRVLQQQWLEKYDGINFVPAFSGEMYLNDSKTERGVLKDVMLGRPQLSFEPAALDNSRALLTLSILGGSFTAYEQNTGLLYSYEITEAQGYTLTIKLDLSLVVGVVDRLGRVTLKLTDGVEFACNLAAPAASQQKIGEFFHERFRQLPLERQVYEVGYLDLNRGGDLCPTDFIILTQRAPGAELPGAANAQDGAVVVMIKLRGSEKGGDIPSKDLFPYLIPDDQQNGVPLYSATLVLSEDYVSRADDEKLELLQSILFPGRKNVFVEHSRHTPRDMVVFGSLEPSTSSMTVQPEVHSMKAGGSPITYKAYINGAPVSDVTWSVKPLNTIGSGGRIDPATGVYTPVSAAQIGTQLARNIVTATWLQPPEDGKPAVEHRVSALVLVTTEAMTLSPACVPRQVRGAPVTFVATALSGSTLTWSKPEYGTLVANGNTAVYTPPAQDLPEHFLAQPIEVSDGTGETVQACVVLSNFAATMKIEPAFVSTLARSGTVKLEEQSDVPIEFERRWQVLGDDGGTVQDGLFQAPAQSTKPFSVVKCDIFYENFLVKTGYSIIKLKNFDDEPGWTMVGEFNLTALRSKKLYNNGLQMVPIEIHIETNGRSLTAEEEASVRLHFLSSRNQVSEIQPGQDGIPYVPGSNVLWAQASKQNDYNTYQGTFDSDASAAPAAELPNRFTRYLVTRDKEVTAFFALIHNPDGVPLPSDQYPGEETGIIKIEPQPSPEFNPSNFSFVRRRMSEGGEGDAGDKENEADFDKYLTTVDYYDIELKEGLRALTFRTLELARPQPGERSPVSIVAWESPWENEKMFSFTGYAFNDPKKDDDRNVMHYDSLIKANPILKPVLEHSVRGGVAEGRLLLALFRRTDVQQDDWRGKPGNKDLHPLKRENGRPASLQMILTDNEGHRHAIRITFRDGNRNRFSLTALPEL